MSGKDQKKQSTTDRLVKGKANRIVINIDNKIHWFGMQEM